MRTMEDIRAYQKAYREKHPEKFAGYAKNWNEKNPEYRKTYYAIHADKHQFWLDQAKLRRAKIRIKKSEEANDALKKWVEESEKKKALAVASETAPRTFLPPTGKPF